MFNHHQNTKTNCNILSFIWQSAIDHPRNNKKKKREKDKSIVKRQQNTKPTLIFFALSQSTTNWLLLSLTSLTDFVVIFRSMNVLVFEWSTWT